MKHSLFPKDDAKVHIIFETTKLFRLKDVNTDNKFFQLKIVKQY